MATPVKAPPMPTHAPDVHLKNPGARKPPRTLKGDLKALKGKVSSARTKWSDGRKSAEGKKEKLRKEAGEILSPVKKKLDDEKEVASEIAKPVFRAMQAVKSGLDPANGKTRPYVTSFGISAALSWILSPQILVAAYERIRFHTSTTDWGILHGPGRWFRDTLGMVSETGQTFGLVAAICMGLAPMFLFSVRNGVARYLAQSPYHGKMARFALTWLARAPYLVPAIYLTGIPYPKYVTALFGSPWRLEMWHFYVAGLFCTAYYCTMWVLDRVERLHRERLAMSDEERAKAKTMGPGLFHALLMVPAASVVTGFALYAPGAAW